MNDVTWSELLEYFGYALSAAFAAGCVIPRIGCYLLVRRSSFLGLALPQFATAGVVFGFVLLPWWSRTLGIGGVTVENALDSQSHAAMNYHLFWAALFTFGGLALVNSRVRSAVGEVAHVAAAFALAVAATFVFGRWSPLGKGHVETLIEGELLGVDLHELEVVLAAFGVVFLLAIWFQRDLLIVSFDRDSALVLRKRVKTIELLLVLLTGVTVSVGTLFLGPTLVFGLLVLPPLAARAWARSMNSFLVIASALGIAAVALGVFVSFELDLPLGPAIVAAAGCFLIPNLWRRT